MQVLADTSVWVGHFKAFNPHLKKLIERDCVLTHPLILGELACGTPPQRVQTLAAMGLLQKAQQASLQETLDLIERKGLFGQGCGIVDMLLLASTLITPNAQMWTYDNRLANLARQLNILYQP
ncbi:MAG TPA: VapC toxin family PIN domain ribonuclease [Limnobacter sp.]|uniref:type II toxin-antitoxin system VapC family toxin n=1 Tax=Limnobacter sp. TaxID=2003368 RepID=UPI002ED9751F